MFLVVALADVLTGYELRLSIFYTIPILLVTWTVGEYFALGMAFLSMASAIFTDMFIRRPFGQPGPDAWVFLGTLAFYLMMIGLTIHFKEALKLAETLARHDGLTRLPNAYAFYEETSYESARCCRTNRPLTLVYFDCDNFKQVNDTCGHLVGNEVLCTIADTLRANLRMSDRAGRLGGDEFAVLFPELGVDEVQAVMIRLQHHLLTVMQQHQWPVTFSIGMVTFSVPPEDVDAMVQQADHLMYTVKRQGKNQIAHAVDAAPAHYLPRHTDPILKL